MTLASSGSINLAGASSSPQRSILAELGATAPISLISTSTRSLSGVSSGPITMPTDFYGKSLVSYSLYRPYTSVTEGNAVPVVALTSGVPDSTILYWTIVNGSTTNADFTIPFGSVTISGGSGQINITPVSDSITETGGETFGVQLRTGSTSGPVVATSGAITINDPTASGYLYYFGGTGYSSFSGSYYWIVPDGITSLDILMVGGGGGGGSAIYTGSGSSVAGAGGGGGGQVKIITGYSVTPGEILTINIGSGGSTGATGGTTDIQGNSGATYIAAEGGGGGGSTVSSGGVGGTGGYSKSVNAGLTYYANGTTYLSGGGGSGTAGPGAPGGENTPGQGGEGGPGVTQTFGPLTVDLGAGGGGGSYSADAGGQGGMGGIGGNGSGATGSNTPVAGTMYTGGGGGGARGRSSGVSSNEYGAAGGYGRIYLLSSVEPTPSLPSTLSLSSTLNSQGGFVSTWNELVFWPDGRMTQEEGNSSIQSIAYNSNHSWLTSSEAGTSTSTSIKYDIELTPSTHTLGIDGIRYSSLFGGQTRETFSTGTAWNTRLQLGLDTIGRFLSAESNGSGVTYEVTEYINFTATIYLHATNTVVTSTQVSFYVDSTDGEAI